MSAAFLDSAAYGAAIFGSVLLPWLWPMAGAKRPYREEVRCQRCKQVRR